MRTAHPSSEPAIWGYFKRLNEAEPVLAIRLALLQGAIALGLSWIGAPHGSVPEEFREFPASLLGLFDESSVIFLGYPVREVVWSGDWWRLLTGIVLPPGLGWFAFSLIAFLPFARVLEERLSRIQAALVYLMGGVAVVGFDFLTSSTPTAGGLGIVFAAGGGAAALRLRNRPDEAPPAVLVPTSAWMSLLLLSAFAWTSSETAILLAQSAVYAGSVEISPTLLGLAVATLTGFFVTLPFLHTPGGLPPTEGEIPGNPTPHRLGLGWRTLLAGIWGAALFGVGGYAWRTSASVDWTLWKIDPLLRAGEPTAFQIAESLVAAHPEDAFLWKRVAVAHAETGNHARATDILGKLSQSAHEKKNDGARLRADLVRRLRVHRLHRRDAKTVLPVRFSGYSSNYDTDNLRLLWDRGHVARLGGMTEELSGLRVELIAAVDQLTPTTDRLSEDLSNEAKRREAIVLNHRAYVRAELAGDLEQASKEASLAVALSPSSENLDTLAWIQVRLGHPAEAVSLLERALLYDDPNSAGTIHYHLGRAQELLGEAQAARKHFESALRHDLEWWEALDLAERCPSCLETESAL